MSTGYQKRNQAPLWQETKWAVVSDPPNQMASVMRFDTKEEAEEFLPKAGPYSYIISPSNSRGKK